MRRQLQTLICPVCEITQHLHVAFLQTVVGSCDWLVQCSGDKLTVSLKAELLDHTYLNLLMFRCSLLQNTETVAESESKFLHPVCKFYQPFGIIQQIFCTFNNKGIYRVVLK